MIGASFYNWCHQHFLGHHPFTNVTEPSRTMDPDVVTNDPDVRRIKESQTFLNHYKYQVVRIFFEKKRFLTKTSTTLLYCMDFWASSLESLISSFFSQ